MQLRDPLGCRRPSPVDYGGDVEQEEHSPHRKSPAQALEEDDVVGRGGAGDGKAFAVARPGEVSDDTVVGEIRELLPS
jgi:hypothetical protein